MCSLPCFLVVTRLKTALNCMYKCQCLACIDIYLLICLTKTILKRFSVYKLKICSTVIYDYIML